MTKTLIIAEKPSVAGDIARALGGFARHDDYYESDRYLLSSAVGHLLEIGMPEDEEVKRGKWTFAHLPAIPSKFALKPIEKNEKRLKTLLKLIKSKEVAELINACDAGREGELIFRYIVQYAKTAKPIRRLWLQSMTPAAIRDAFGKLRADREMRPLADAAVCRSESDWLVGINGTRAMTAFNSKSGGFQLTTVGRVQTPTLAILTEREERIRAFVPRDYWEVLGTFRASGGEYGGRWFDEDFRKREDDEHARAERLWEEAKARAIAAKCEGRPGTVTEESKPSTQGAPLRLARAPRGLLRHRQRDDGRSQGDRRLRPARHSGTEAEVGEAQQADLRQWESLRPLRDHPDARHAEAPERDRGEALRFHRPPLHRRVLSAGRVHADHTDHARCGRAVQVRGQSTRDSRLACGLR
jgi:DNA topoisomerase-3